MIDVISHLVPHEAQPTKSPLDQPALVRWLRLDHAFAGLGMMAVQSSVLAPLLRSPPRSRFHESRQRLEQNLACSRRGANAAPHCSQIRVSRTEIMSRPTVESAV